MSAKGARGQSPLHFFLGKKPFFRQRSEPIVRKNNVLRVQKVAI